MILSHGSLVLENSAGGKCSEGSTMQYSAGLSGLTLRGLLNWRLLYMYSARVPETRSAGHNSNRAHFMCKYNPHPTTTTAPAIDR